MASGVVVTSRILAALWLFYASTLSVEDTYLHDTCSPCTCTETVMTCTGSNITFIPRPDSNVTSVQFVGVFFSEKYFYNLDNLTAVGINNFGFSHCDLTDTILELDNLTSLKHFEISKSRTEDLIMSLLFYSLRNVPIKTISVANAINGSLFDLDTSKYPVLEELIFSDNSIPDVSKAIFNSLSLKRLVFSDNGCSVFHNGIFSGTPSLEFLDVSGNDFSQVSSAFLSSVFSTNLEHLETLSIKSANLRYLKSDMFSNLPNLRYLDLTSNLISQLPGGVFNKLTNLLWLNVSSNALKTLRNSSLPTNVPVDLSRNPFNCSCDLLWFLNAIQENKIHLLGSPTSYVCTSPAELANKTLAKMPITPEDCPKISESNNSVSVIIPSVVVSLIILVFLFILSFYFRKSILKIFRGEGSLPYYRMRAQ